MKHFEKEKILLCKGRLLVVFLLVLFIAFPLPVEAVKGATRGSSASELVEDRRVWEEWPEPYYGEGYKVTAEDVHIPRFLLESEDAVAANAELDKVEAYMAEEYKYNLEFAGEYYSPLSTDFSVYQDEAILSVHVSFFDIGMNDNEHLIYNFRLADGKRLNDGEMAEYLGISDRLQGLMEESIAAEYVQPPYYMDEPVAAVFSGGNIEFFEGFALVDMWDNYLPENYSIFLDEAGQARLIYRFYGPAGSGSYSSETELKLLLRYADREISPVYLRMARVLGIDPEDESYDALMVFIGSVYDETSTLQMLTRLWPWQEEYYRDYSRPTALIRAEYSEEVGRYVLEGYEFYLLVPKYKHAAVSLFALEMTEEGELMPAEYSQLDSRCVSGPVLIGQNQSDLWPNAEILLSYRGEEIRFSPQISLQDGSMITHERVLDAGAVFDWEELSPEEMEYAPFSYELYETLLTFLGVGFEEEPVEEAMEDPQP